MEFDSWYDWFVGMLNRKADVAEKNAIRHLVEQTRAETLKEIEKELFEIVHSRTKAVAYKKAVKLWQSINQELRSNPVG